MEAYLMAKADPNLTIPKFKYFSILSTSVYLLSSFTLMEYGLGYLFFYFQSFRNIYRKWHRNDGQNCGQLEVGNLPAHDFEIASERGVAKENIFCFAISLYGFDSANSSNCFIQPLCWFRSWDSSVYHKRESSDMGVQTANYQHYKEMNMMFNHKVSTLLFFIQYLEHEWGTCQSHQNGNQWTLLSNLWRLK